MMVKKIIIDCDPGVDDAIAILLACASPELEILGITTVAGNVPLSFTSQNALKICQLAGRSEIPVYAGCPRPMMRPLETAGHVHGVTGLQVDLPEPQRAIEAQHGVDFLIQTLMNAAEPLTIATLGPLTNLAIALIQAPQIVPQIKEVVLMGGAIGQGNVTASAEFNIYVDPHAAAVVFDSGLKSGLKLTMIGLDVTHKVLTTPERLQQIRAIGTRVGTVAADLLAKYGMHDVEQFGMPGSPLHDPCVIAYLMRPELFEGKDLNVEVETMSERGMGRTVVDVWNSEGRSANANVILRADDMGFYQLLVDRLARL